MTRCNLIPAAVVACAWLACPAYAAAPTDASPAHVPASQPADDTSDTMDDLIQRLREGRGGGEDLSQRIVRLMDGSQRRLARRFDTGESTQVLQQQILEELDAAIDIAKRNLRPSPSSGKPQPQQGEKRKAGRRPQKQQSGAAGDKRSTESGKQDSSGGTPSDDQATDGTGTPARRSWGNLPDRDREAVIQAFKEDFLRKYGELIEEYYRALSEEVEE